MPGRLTDKQTCLPLRVEAPGAQHHEEKSHEALFRARRLLTLAPYRVTRSRADIRPGERQPSCNTSPTWPRHRDLSRPQAAKSVSAPRNGSISSPRNCTRTSALYSVRTPPTTTSPSPRTTLRTVSPMWISTFPIDPISSATSSRWRTPICSPSSTAPSSSRSIWRRGRICSNSWPA